MSRARETLRHKEAFEYYLYLGAERNLQKVSEKYKVSLPTVKKWSHNFGWKNRIVEREQELAERFKKENEDEITQIKRQNLTIIRGFKSKLVNALNRGKVKPKTTKDLERIVKLEALVMGEPTERPEIIDRRKVTKDIDEIFGVE